MSQGERYVVLGLAKPRSPWFTELARWATSGAAPVEFVKSVTAEEAQARLASGRRFSALLVDATVAGCDRDMIVAAGRQRCAVVVIDDRGPQRDWAQLGAAEVLPAAFTREELIETLGSVAEPVPRAQELAGALMGEPAVPTPGRGVNWQGRLVAVTGAGGTGRSTLAMALAGGLATDPRDRGLVLLADLALDAQQALLHDSGDVVPGLAEMVEAHRRGCLSPDEVRRMCFCVPAGGYDLLAGLRRHRDWAGLRPAALATAVTNLRATYRLVVADVDADVEGAAECGLVDLEERNQMARITLRQADIVVVVGRAGLAGMHRHLRVLAALHQFGVAPERMVAVINQAPRHPRRRAELTASLMRLLADVAPEAQLAVSPVFVPERRHLDDALATGGRMPTAVTSPITDVTRALLDRTGVSPRTVDDTMTSGLEPVAVSPGSLGLWAEGAQEGLP